MLTTACCLNSELGLGLGLGLDLVSGWLMVMHSYLYQWSFRKTGTVKTLVSQADIGVCTRLQDFVFTTAKILPELIPPNISAES